MDADAGRVIVRGNVVGTALFAMTATYAAVAFTTPAQWIGAVTAMSLFAIGVFAFLWSYWNAVQRSRADQIAVSQLYLLLGPAIPARIRRTMNLVLIAQFATATATALARPNGPDGNPGSSLAVGFLVPMLGFGLNGLWAVYHGSFEPRAGGGDPSADPRADAAGSDDTVDTVGPAASSEPAGPDGPDGPSVSGSGRPIGQNADHG